MNTFEPSEKSLSVVIGSIILAIPILFMFIVGTLFTLMLVAGKPVD